MRDATIGEAMAKKDSDIEKSLANETLLAAKYENSTAIAQAKRNFDIKKAKFDVEVQTQVCV